MTSPPRSTERRTQDRRKAVRQAAADEPFFDAFRHGEMQPASSTSATSQWHDDEPFEDVEEAHIDSRFVLEVLLQRPLGA